MPGGDDPEVCAVLFPPPPGDPGRVHSHRIVRTTPKFLENAVELELTTRLEGGTLAAEVAVINAHTGHHVPSGVTIRNMILLVEAWTAGDAPDSGALPEIGGQRVHELGGTGNPALGDYGGLPGKLYAKINHQADGSGLVFFTEATGITQDNRIPALATDTTQYRFVLPPEGGAVQVRGRLIYRRAFRFLTLAKQWTMDGHGNPLADVLPPHYGHLMAMREAAVAVAPSLSVALLSGPWRIVLPAALLAAVAVVRRRVDFDKTG